MASIPIESYPNLFQPYDWGNVRSQFEIKLPPVELISNVNIIPFVGDKCVIIQLDDGKWEMPGGTLAAGEDYITALRRELVEEAGAKLVSSYTPFGAWRFLSSAENPYKPHLPHPLFFRLVGYGDVQLVSAPVIPEDGEKVVAVEAVSLEEAKRHFIETGRTDLAELYELASNLRMGRMTL